MGMIETASRIIARFGQSGTFERPGVQSGPPYAPVYGDPTLHPATVAVVTYDQAYRDGTLIQANDLRILVSVEGLDIVPTVSDRLTVGGVQGASINLAPLGPDGVARFYDMQVRR